MCDASHVGCPRPFGVGQGLVSSRTSAFFKLALVVLAATLGVILWGAYVRATGSGAGCGSHWPTCNGAIVPRNPSTATVIEFAHRTSSGIAFVLVVIQLVFAWRLFPRGHGVRRAAAAGMALMVSEALVGAGLVLFEMVAGNTAVARAYWMAAHLLNTFALLAALGLCAWRARPGAEADVATNSAAPVDRRFRGAMTAGLAAVLLVAISGAVVALGDTLFPASSLGEGLRQDLAPGAHLFVRLRLYHPLLAVLAGIYLLVVTALIASRDPSGRLRRPASTAAALVLGQLGLGFANLALLAPVALQILHLLAADLVWLSLVVLAAAVRAQTAPAAAPSQSMQGPVGLLLDR
jgi:heme A synthase